MKLSLVGLRKIIREEIEKSSEEFQRRNVAGGAMDILADEAATNPRLRYDQNVGMGGAPPLVIARLDDPETGAFVELVLQEPDTVVVRWAAEAARPKVDVLKGDSRDDRTVMNVIDDAFGGG